MKRIITATFFALVAISLFSVTAYSQTLATDQIALSQIALKPTGSTGEAFQLSGTPTQMLRVFGEPETTSNAFAEAGSTSINRYNFKDIEAFFEGNKLFSLRIKGAAVTLSLHDKINVKTGDHISSIGTVFPNAFASKKDGQMVIGIIPTEGTASGTSIAFLYDEKGMITGVVL